MDVYLVQQGRAFSAEQDPQRPLSEAGRAVVSRTAGHLAMLGPRLVDPPITEIRHSGKLRAQQTAEILASALAPRVQPTACAGMSPNDDPRVLFSELHEQRDREGAILLAGHLPHLARLAGLLLAGDLEQTPIRFVNAGVLRLRPVETGWTVEWFLTPACVR